MYQVILDTVVMGEFLAQFFDRQAASRGAGRFVPAGWITNDLARRLNRILDLQCSGFLDEDSPHSGSGVVISSFAFVELVRKWDDIVEGRFGMLEFRVFLDQPPEWVIIDPLDEFLTQAFAEVPSRVLDHNGNWLSIEWADAVHAATTISRGRNAMLATSDKKMTLIPELKGRVIELSRS